jgi:hypothetical protein
MLEFEYESIILDAAAELKPFFEEYDNVSGEVCRDTANSILEMFPEISLYLVKNKKVSPSSVISYIAEDLFDRIYKQEV